MRLVDLIAQTLVVTAMVGELCAVLANLVARTFFGNSFLWADEIARLALSILAFIGGALAYRYRHHSFISFVLKWLPAGVRQSALALTDVIVLGVAVATAIASVPLVVSNWSELTPVLHFPAGLLTLPLTVSMTLIAIYALQRLWEDHGLHAVVVGGACVAFGLLLQFVHSTWLSAVSPAAALTIAMACFVVTLFAGLPIAFTLVFSAVAYIWLTGVAPLVEIPHNMVAGTSNFVLLALPFFIVAGLVMERGGISLRLVQFIQTMVGHVRGGLLQVLVVSMYVVSGLSGSKSADVAAVGTVMRDMLEREGYSRGECAAALASSAAMGETVPPSISILVLGSITSLSMSALFVGGLIPAAVIALCLMVLIYARASYAGITPSPRAPVAAMGRAALRSILPLLMPAILFGGILTGIATPTEISALAIIYGLMLAMGLYRTLKLDSLARILTDGATFSGMVLFILAAAQCFSWVLTNAYVPQQLVEALHGVHDNQALFFLGSIVLLIVAGSLLEGLPALNILAPLLLPIAGRIGINPLHYGIVLVIAIGIGAFLPPTGVGFYVCCAVSRASIEDGTRAMFPYLAVLLVGLLLVAAVPWFTTFLPKATGLLTGPF